MNTTVGGNSSSAANTGFRWNALNQPATSSVTKLLAFISFALFLPYFVLAIPPTSGPNGTLGPPLPGDSQDYDNIGLNLARGRGFGVYFDDHEWRAPYEQHNQQSLYDGILARRGDYSPTAYRPPGYPLVLSLVYRTAGRSFFAVRLVNALLLAATVTLSVLIAGRCISVSCACLVIVIGLIDSVLRSYSGSYMTEPLATCAFVLMLSRLLVAIEKPGTLKSLVAGFCCGLLVLARSLFVLWIPLLALLVGCSLQLKILHFKQPTTRWRRFGLSVVFLAGALLIVAPWWTRNCVVLQAFMPLGTQGGEALVAAYSDEIIKTNGNWTPEPAQKVLQQHFESLERIDEPIVLEREKTRILKAHAWRWIRENYYKVPQLAALKFVAHWYPGYDFAGYLLRAFALIGCMIGVRLPAVRFCIGVLVIDSLAVAATYEDHHRFIVVIYPMLYFLASIGAFHSTRWLGDVLARQLRAAS